MLLIPSRSPNYYNVCITCISHTPLTHPSHSFIDLGASFINFKAFRVFRLLRVARLFRNVGGMQVILLMVRKSLASLMHITVVLLFFLFLFAVLGRQLFAGTLRPPPAGAPKGNCAGEPGEMKPRQNFDSFWEAFVTTFQIAIYDDWGITMFREMEATTNWAVVRYCVACLSLSLSVMSLSLYCLSLFFLSVLSLSLYLSLYSLSVSLSLYCFLS